MRQRGQELGALEISATTCRSAPAGFARAVMSRHIHRIIGRQWENWAGRQRKLEIDRLTISATSGRPSPLGFGIFLIRVSICQGGSLSLGTSNYRGPRGKRGRSTEESATRPSGDIRYAWAPRAIMFRDLPEPCRHLPWMFCFA